MSYNIHSMDYAFYRGNQLQNHNKLHSTTTTTTTTVLRPFVQDYPGESVPER